MPRHRPDDSPAPERPNGAGISGHPPTDPLSFQWPVASVPAALEVLVLQREDLWSPHRSERQTSYDRKGVSNRTRLKLNAPNETFAEEDVCTSGHGTPCTTHNHMTPVTGLYSPATAVQQADAMSPAHAGCFPPTSRRSGQICRSETHARTHSPSPASCLACCSDVFVG